MATLTEGVLVRHPETGEPAFLPAGSTLPSWAGDLVGEHALGGGGGNGYADMTVDALKAEIDTRNEDRGDDAKLPKTGNKADLVAVLTADDAA